MPRAATVETKVMVMERLMSPLSSNVQKLDPVPPGQVPKTKRPNLKDQRLVSFGETDRYI